MSKYCVKKKYNLYVKSSKEVLICLLSEIKENHMDEDIELLFTYNQETNKLYLKIQLLNN